MIDRRPILQEMCIQSRWSIQVLSGAHISIRIIKSGVINQFAEFNRLRTLRWQNYHGELYSCRLCTPSISVGVVTPQEAAAKIEEQRKAAGITGKNLEEQAISLVGTDIYEKLIKGYTQKQWGRVQGFHPLSSSVFGPSD